MSDTELLAALQRTRADYAVERTWHKFLLDAYAGTGGFMGRVRLPFTGYWGPASEIYAPNNVALNSSVRGSMMESNLDTYLERFPREDMDKFARRHWASQYPNYIEPIVDIRMSFMHRKPFTREGVDPGVQEWMADADGTGTPWDKLRKETIDFRAALLGWCPVLFDRTRPEGVDPGEEMSVAQATELGVRVNAIPMFPANLLDWDVDDRGHFVWVKTVRAEHVRPDPMAEGFVRAVYTLWARDTVQRFEVIHEKKTDRPVVIEGPVLEHGYGFVPILINKHKKAHDAPVRGLPMAGAPSLMARKLFNYYSELDEHIGSAVFAFLQVPVKKLPQPGELELGSGNALPVDQASTRDYKYISPDASVAKTLEERIRVTTEEIYRVGRTEFARARMASGGAESGTARAFAFENTNRAISDFAANVASFDEQALQTVAFLQSGTETAGENLRTIAPARFDVEEMSRQLDEALSAVGLGIGPTATAELKKRLVQRLLPNLGNDLQGVIEQELDEMRKLDASAGAFEVEQEAQAPAEDAGEERAQHAHIDPLPDADGNEQPTGFDVPLPDDPDQHTHERPDGTQTEPAAYGEGHVHQTPDGPTGPNGIDFDDER